LLGRPLARLPEMTWAQSRSRLPVVLTSAEVQGVLGNLSGVYWVLGMLLYGSGLRLLEAVTLRVKDIDLGRCEIRLRTTKGGAPRITMVPRRIRDPIAEHLERVRVLHARDLAAGGGAVELSGLWRGSIGMQAASGRGNGFSRPPVAIRRPPRASGGAIIYTRVRCNGRSRRRSARRESRSRPPVTVFDTRLRPTCWNRATTSGPFSSCSGIGALRPR